MTHILRRRKKRKRHNEFIQQLEELEIVPEIIEFISHHATVHPDYCFNFDAQLKRDLVLLTKSKEDQVLYLKKIQEKPEVQFLINNGTYGTREKSATCLIGSGHNNLNIKSKKILFVEAYCMAPSGSYKKVNALYHLAKTFVEEEPKLKGKTLHQQSLLPLRKRG